MYTDSSKTFYIGEVKDTKRNFVLYIFGVCINKVRVDYGSMNFLHNLKEQETEFFVPHCSHSILTFKVTGKG